MSIHGKRIFLRNFSLSHDGEGPWHEPSPTQNEFDLLMFEDGKLVKVTDGCVRGYDAGRKLRTLALTTFLGDPSHLVNWAPVAWTPAFRDAYVFMNSDSCVITIPPDAEVPPGRWDYIGKVQKLDCHALATRENPWPFDTEEIQAEAQAKPEQPSLTMPKLIAYVLIGNGQSNPKAGPVTYALQQQFESLVKQFAKALHNHQPGFDEAEFYRDCGIKEWLR